MLSFQAPQKAKPSPEPEPMEPEAEESAESEVGQYMHLMSYAISLYSHTCFVFDVSRYLGVTTILYFILQLILYVWVDKKRLLIDVTGECRSS